MRSGRYIVTAGNLDAIDFVAAAILSKLGYDVDVVVDLTRPPSTKPELRNFDPTSAVPIPQRYAVSPDGSMRQLVIPAGDVLQDIGLPQEPLSVLFQASTALGNDWKALLRTANEYRKVGDLGSAGSFMKACYTALGCSVRVRERVTRLLDEATVESVGSRLNRVLLRQGISGRVRITNGGYVAAGQQTYSDFIRDTSGVVGIATNGTRARWSDIAASTNVELGGPLDAMSFLSSGNVALGHIPYFTEIQVDPDSAVPAVEVVRSLFLKFPQSRPWKFSEEPSAVLASDYVEAQGLALYADVLDERRSDWLTPIVQGMADMALPCEERWAASQSAIAQIGHQLRQSRVSHVGSGVVGRLLERARVALDLGKTFHTHNSKDVENRIWKARDDLTISIGDAVGLFGRFGIPLEFRPERSCSLREIEKRSRECSSETDPKKSISDTRFLAWEIVRTAFAAIALFADTSWRSSLPWLALFAGVDRFDRFVKTNRSLLVRRCESVEGFRII